MIGADKPAQVPPPPLDRRGVPLLGEVRDRADRRLDGAAATRAPATREGVEHGRD